LYTLLTASYTFFGLFFQVKWIPNTEVAYS
jgi:hypothetical protein